MPEHLSRCLETLVYNSLLSRLYAATRRINAFLRCFDLLLGNPPPPYREQGHRTAPIVRTILRMVVLRLSLPLSAATSSSRNSHDNRPPPSMTTTTPI